MQTLTLEVKIDENGDGYGEVAVVDGGPLRELSYVPKGKSSDPANSFTITVVSQATGRTIFTEVVNAAKSSVNVPYSVELQDEGGDKTTEWGTYYLGTDVLQFTITNGGQYRTAMFNVVIG